MRRQPSMSMSMGGGGGGGGDAVGTPRGLSRSSSSGVWWKLGDTTAAGAADASEVGRRLRAIAEEEAAVRARVERRDAVAPAVRRRIAFTSMSLEVVALVYGLWTARRRGKTSKLKLLLPAVAIPAMATLVLAAFARFRRMLDGRDEQQLKRLRTERKAKLGNFRGSHHNLQKLIEKYDPDAAAAADSGSSNKNDDAAASKKQVIKRTHSRLSCFHVGDE